MKRVMQWIFPIVLLLSFSFTLPLVAQDDAYTPTEGWRVSTPEAQGMDSERLADMIDSLLAQEGGPNIHNLLVIRNGYVVLDASVPPFSTSQPHALFSATKVLVSTLAGVAQQQGYIESPDQSLWDFFDPADYANVDERKLAITLADLMTQRSGLGLNAGIEIPWWEADDALMLTLTADDSDVLKFILDFPMDSEPGTLYRYSNGNPYIVNAVIQQATGQPFEQFAAENLFAPLGITDYAWRVSPQGIPGGGALLLSAHDLAKIGLLYMNGGVWDGQQILSQEWIDAAWARYFAPHYLDGYGYYWYVDAYSMRGARGFAAVGLEGQYLYTFPTANVIVVINGDFNYSATSLLQSFILRSIQGDDPLPDNPEAAAHLAASLEAFTNPAPIPVTELPAAANALDGRIYALPENLWGWESLAFDFGADDATLYLTARGEQLTLPVGLDGTYRVSADGFPTDPIWQYLPGVPLASRGWWLSEEEFHVRIRSTLGIQEFEMAFSEIAQDGSSVHFEAFEVGTGQMPTDPPRPFYTLSAQ